ncbi:MAG: hypothetical protein JSR77_16965 [Planctomycetes bacterium]|nr:hypothetical protein [Planctomycetota bacterium]
MSKLVRYSVCALIAAAGAASAQDIFPFTDEGGPGPGGLGWEENAIAIPYYTLDGIATLGGLESYATSISDNGWIVGGSKDAAGVNKAFRLRDGVMQNLGSLPGLPYSSANDVNNNGDVVGVAAASSNLWGSTAQPWICRNGGTWWADLDPYNRGVFAAAAAINNNGVVLGTNSFTGSGTLDAFTWSTGSPTMQPRLPNDTCRISYGQGINDAGVAVGYTAEPGMCGTNWAVKYQNGQVVHLPGLGGDNNVAEAINDFGDAVGSAEEVSGQVRAVRYTAGGSIENLGSPAGASFGLSTNNEGTVVGYFIDNRNTQRAFVMINGNMFDLNGLIPASSGWRLLIATDINNAGEIVGQGRNPQGRLRGFKLTPPCRSDFNRDGGIDGVDVETFFDAWGSNLPEADTNLDGGTDGADVQYFFNLWDAGRC